MFGSRMLSFLRQQPSSNPASRITTCQSFIEDMWFYSLLYSPLVLLEFILVLLLTRTRLRRLFLFVLLNFIFGSLAFSYFSSSSLGNKAVWTTFPYFGNAKFILQEKLRRPRPVIPGFVVVNVKATSLNPADYKALHKTSWIPFLRWILPHSLTYNIAGIVQESNCDLFKAGDRVYGISFFGGTQNFVLADCKSLGKIPNLISYEAASTVPTIFASGKRALDQSKPGDNILIVGASGGCGHAGSLLAKQFNPGRVYCISSEKNKDFVKKKGCDEVLTYDSKNFKDELARLTGKIDLIYDTVTSFDSGIDYYPRLKSLLKPNGKYMALNGYLSDLIHTILRYFTGIDYRRFELVHGRPIREDYDFFYEHAEMFNQVEISEVLDGLSVKQVSYAYEKLQNHHVVGKIVLKIDN